MIALLAAAVLAAEPTVEELLDATDDVSRGASSHAVLEMYVKTANYERTMRMEAWSQGEDRSLVILREPAKDAGVATLKVDDNIWNYLPKVDRTMKIPAGMMSGSWMGSHFTNDDLVKGSRLADDYTYAITGRPPDSDGVYVITLVPKPDAPVVWGKVVVRVTPDKIPTELAFYAEDGSLARTQRFTDVAVLDGRKVPKVMTLVPADKPAELTRITYVTLDFDVELPPEKFSLQALKR
jgi:hypothetical protein